MNDSTVTAELQIGDKAIDINIDLLNDIVAEIVGFTISIHNKPDMPEEIKDQLRNSLVKMLKINCTIEQHKHKEDFCLQSLHVINEFLSDTWKISTAVAYSNKDKVAHLFLDYTSEEARAEMKDMI